MGCVCEISESCLFSGGSFQVSSGKNQEQDGLKKNNDPNVPCEIAEPCLMSSSVYYGGRDDFIPEISSSYKSDSSNNVRIVIFSWYCCSKSLLGW